jgi:hypothetical protein
MIPAVASTAICQNFELQPDTVFLALGVTGSSGRWLLTLLFLKPLVPQRPNTFVTASDDADRTRNIRQIP